jgi:hypothetical protein
MNSIQKLAAGTSLVAIMLFAPSTASAQVTPGNRSAPPGLQTYEAPTPAPSPASANEGLGDLNDLAVVEGEAEAISNRRTPPPVPLAMNMGSRVSYVSRGYWLGKGWSNASFNQRRLQSQNLCTTINYWKAEYVSLFEEYRRLDPKVDELAVRYDKQGRKIKTAGTIRTVLNIAAPVVGFFTGGVGYAGLIGLNSLSGEAQGRASTGSQLIGNDAGKLNTDAMKLHIRASLDSVGVYSDYLDMMGIYCSSPSVVNSFGGASAFAGSATAAPSGSSYASSVMGGSPQMQHSSHTAENIMPPSDDSRR